MILYVVEFALLHTFCFLVYKLLLSKETQLSFLRFFLIGSTLMCLIVPLIEIPNSTPLPTVNLSGFVVSATTPTPTESSTMVWYIWVLGAVGAYFLFRVYFGLLRVFHFYQQSKVDQLFGVSVRKVAGLENSFTFLRWIFIDPTHFDSPEEIVRHEWGHSSKLHSLDILFFHVLAIGFWWQPTLWLMLKELKKVHEYEADQCALQTANQTDYIKTLVHSTLKAHRLNLASSFDDAPIVQRLNFMKKMKKRMNPWKMGSVAAAVAMAGLLFACQDELDAEINKIADQSVHQMVYSDEVQAALEKLKKENPEVKYSVIVTGIENKKSFDKLSEYDPAHIKQMFVNNDGEHKTITLIIDSETIAMIGESSERLHSKEEKNTWLEEEEIFTIVEKAPSYNGGMEAFYVFVGGEMNYPAQARKVGVQGTVYVEFIVEKDGSLSNIHTVKGIGAGCDMEAERVLKLSPKFEPGTQKGKNVRVKMVLPINFKLG